MLKLKPYVEALSATKEQTQADLAPSRANETQKSLELKIAQLDNQIIQAESAITELSRQYPLSVSHLTQSLDQVALLGRQRDQLVTIIGQMFPADAVAAAAAKAK